MWVRQILLTLKSKAAYNSIHYSARIRSYSKSGISFQIAGTGPSFLGVRVVRLTGGALCLQKRGVGSHQRTLIVYPNIIWQRYERS
jgi:hypothetical protein